MPVHLNYAIPLAKQIRGQLTYAIPSEFLTIGQALLSLRGLSTSPGLAPATIAQGQNVWLWPTG
jgi:DNA-binding transcriptional regulator YhcF (GntR family)